MAGVCLAAPACQDRSAEANRVVMRWLKCEECVEDELQAVRDLGNDAVQPLADALRGPPADSTANVESQLGQAYVLVRDRGPAPTLDSTRYVNHYLANYKSLYQSRAISGLAAIGNERAIAALEEARDSAQHDVNLFRTDVRDELERALGGRWASISAGLSRTCGITINGKTYCWGSNDEGQLGDGSGTDRLKATLVSDPSGAGENFRFISIAVGDSGRHTCGISADKLAFCWGDNSRGQLGDGSTEDRLKPTAVDTNVRFVGITVGGNQTCGWTPEYQAFCWGDNAVGELGDGTTTNRPHPTVVANFGPIRISAGAAHTCADSLNNVLYCWGSNAKGQLGSPLPTNQTFPSQVNLHNFVRSMSVGATHTCVLAQGPSSAPEGGASCAGSNGDGQLGDGSTTDRTHFVEVLGPRFLTISAGADHTCGIAVGTRRMYCWGGNQFGQLGTGMPDPATTPTSVSGDRGFVAVSAGAGHTCGITVEGEALCWGLNSEGQLGDSTTTNHPSPVRVAKPN